MSVFIQLSFCDNNCTINIPTGHQCFSKTVVKTFRSMTKACLLFGLTGDF